MPAPESRTRILAALPERKDPHAHPPRGRSELQSIAQQISDHLTEALPIDLHPRRLGARFQIEDHTPIFEERPDGVAAGTHDLPRIETRGLELDLPVGQSTDVQQVVHQTRELLGLPNEDLTRAAMRVGPGSRSLEQHQAVPDRGEWISELVGEHGNEVALQAIRLAELELGLLPRGDVPGQGEERGGRTVLGQLRDELRLVVSRVAAGPVGELQDLGPTGGEDPLEARVPELDQVRWETKLCVGPAQELLPGEARGSLRPRVHVEVPEPPVETGDDVRCVLGERPEALLALLQRGLVGPLAGEPPIDSGPRHLLEAHQNHLQPRLADPGQAAFPQLTGPRAGPVRGDADQSRAAGPARDTQLGEGRGAKGNVDREEGRVERGHVARPLRIVPDGAPVLAGKTPCGGRLGKERVEHARLHR